MSHKSSTHRNESHYQGENLEYRKKMNKIKNYRSKNEKDIYRKTTKSDGGNFEKIRERKKRSERDYVDSKNVNTKSNWDRSRNKSNNKVKPNYRDSDYDTRPRWRKDNDKDHRYSNPDDQGKYKKNIGKQNFFNDSSFQEKFKKKHKSNSNEHGFEKSSKEKTMPKLNNFDYLAKSGDEGQEEEEYYTSEDSNNEYAPVYPPKNEDFSSGVTDSNAENSDNDFIKEKPKPNTYGTKVKRIDIITRSSWDPELGNLETGTPSQQPFNHVNYVDTSSPVCFNQRDCVDVLRFIKDRDKSMKYNFYIGGDNCIYEGKGWVADVNEATGYRKRAVDIAFIGSFTVVQPFHDMIIKVNHLIRAAIECGKITKKFSLNMLLCQPENQ